DHRRWGAADLRRDAEPFLDLRWGALFGPGCRLGLALQRGGSPACLVNLPGAVAAGRDPADQPELAGRGLGLSGLGSVGPVGGLAALRSDAGTARAGAQRVLD